MKDRKIQLDQNTERLKVLRNKLIEAKNVQMKATAERQSIESEIEKLMLQNVSIERELTKQPRFKRSIKDLRGLGSGLARL